MNIRDQNDIYNTILLHNEAAMVRYGIPVTRRFSDADVADVMPELEQAERDVALMNLPEYGA